VTAAQLEAEIAAELDALVSAEPETGALAEQAAEAEAALNAELEAGLETGAEAEQEAESAARPRAPKSKQPVRQAPQELTRPVERNEERLQKILAHAGIASRRHAEELIAAGRVQVNGETITVPGFKADPERDHIRVDGKLLHGSERLRYFVLNKPRGFVTTVSDPEGRPTVMQFFSRLAERLYPVGRLDFQSEGLLLVTNDGPLANNLTRAASGVEKTYLVKVSGTPDEEQLDRLRAGVAIPKGRTVLGKTGPGGPGAGRVPAKDRVTTAPARIRLVRAGENPWLEVILIEGRNRELRKMFEEIGHHVEKIRRVGYGPLHLVNLDPGAIRELTAEELDLLRRAAEGKLKSRKIDFGVLLPKEAGRSVDHEAAKERTKRPYSAMINKPLSGGWGGREKRPAASRESERREGGKSFAPRVGGRTDQRPSPGRGSDRTPNRSSERYPDRGSSRSFDRKPAGKSFGRPERREERPFNRGEGGKPFAARTSEWTGTSRGTGKPEERKPFGDRSGFKPGFKPGGKPGFGQRSGARPAAKSSFGPRSDFGPKSGRPPARFKPDAQRSAPYKSFNSGARTDRTDNPSAGAPSSQERQDRGGFKSAGSRPAFKSSGGGSGFKSGSKPGFKSGFKSGAKSGGRSGFQGKPAGSRSGNPAGGRGGRPSPRKGRS
jgi:23S rRNA pseudouridine2605 synthase